ncbi:hypothetical protein [Dysgonomonas sp. 511]|uniref:hypothetical protein n=1 Tax=Dysgonomonas sp. 511 TaxID=2302930 RepID=UPI0013CF50B0|nr:hypothetical protein [Dysgonomonas sp. 511]NDV78837.1 hypothetical protein [Dysgonomonas sp. 511]
MKKFILLFAILVGVSSFYSTTEAQNINVSINIGRQPAWGPVGYDYVGFYYFPDIDCYYDVNYEMFYYMDRGRWISARYLPYGYRNYDLYRLYKVVLNVREPWRYHHTHVRDYGRYKGYRNQIVIRDSRDHRYHNSRRNDVRWYSSTKSANHGRNNVYKADRPRNNNNNQTYKRDYKQDNRKNNSNIHTNKNRNNSNKNSYDSSKNQRRDNSKSNSNVNRPSQSNRGEYRLASNTGRKSNTERNRR